MTKVNMELALDFRRLHNLGLSYIDIAEEYGLNNKTVSDWVKKAVEFDNDQHWNGIRKDLDARLMREHHQMLLAAALGVSRAVATPPLLVGPGQLADVLVDYHILTGLQGLEEILTARGIDNMSGEIGSPRSEDMELLERMADKLRSGLFEHLPELRAAKEQWSLDWQRFREQKEKLVTETAGALVQRGRGADLENELASNAVAQALASEFGQRVNEDLTDPDLDFAVGQADSRSGDARSALARVRASVAACRGLVEDALLRGGLPGGCPSCPGGPRATAS